MVENVDTTSETKYSETTGVREARMLEPFLKTDRLTASSRLAS